ncbi:hypothetical protein J6590_086895 [Homalodisca vitripennis]|nr:hypothetical protein J6590_086895 [Homalodisca vitripennis]
MSVSAWTNCPTLQKSDVSHPRQTRRGPTVLQSFLKAHDYLIFSFEISKHPFKCCSVSKTIPGLPLVKRSPSWVYRVISRYGRETKHRLGPEDELIKRLECGRASSRLSSWPVESLHSARHHQNLQVLHEPQELHAVDRT